MALALLVGAAQAVGGLQSIAGDAGDRQLVGLDAAVRVETRGDGRGHAACRLGEDAFGLGQFLDRGDDLDVGDILGPSARVANHARGVDAVGRIADRQRARNGVRALRLDHVRVVLDGLRDGRAAGGLRAEEAAPACLRRGRVRSSSLNALRILVISEPPAMGTTTLSGRRQPSCSAIS